LEANFDKFCVDVRVNIFLKSIMQYKYRINLFPTLIRLINIHKMSYFYKGINLAKKYKISLFIEFFEFSRTVPRRIIRKARKISNKISGKAE